MADKRAGPLWQRAKIWWELLRPSWHWIVAVPITLLGTIGTIRDEIIEPENPQL